MLTILLFIHGLLSNSPLCDGSISTPVQSKTDFQHQLFCNRLIPGLERMTHGIDITRLDLYSKGLNTDDGFRTTIFELTCNLQRKWTHENIANVEYDRPDQIDSIDTVSNGRMNVNGKLYRTAGEFKSSLLVNIGVQFGVDNAIDKTFGSFSASTNFKAALDMIFSKNISFYEISATASSVRIDLGESPFLNHSKAFSHYLNELTGNYDEQPAKYDEFVHKFGTHYFASGTFGGLLKQTISVNKSYFQEAEELDFKNNIEASLFPIFNVNANVDLSASESHKKFKRISKIKFSYFGGITDMMPKSDKIKFFTKRVPTVNKLPWLLGGRLVSLENLIQNETIKTQLKRAIHIHRIKAHFQELNLTKTLSGFKFKDEQLSKFIRLQRSIELKSFNSTDQMTYDIQELLDTVQHAYSTFVSTERPILDQSQAKNEGNQLDDSGCKIEPGSHRLCPPRKNIRTRSSEIFESKNIYEIDTSAMMFDESST